MLANILACSLVLIGTLPALRMCKVHNRQVVGRAGRDAHRTASLRLSHDRYAHCCAMLCCAQVLVNGPGTCIPVCAAAWVNRCAAEHDSQPGSGRAVLPAPVSTLSCMSHTHIIAAVNPKALVRMRLHQHMVRSSLYLTHGSLSLPVDASCITAPCPPA